MPGPQHSRDTGPVPLSDGTGLSQKAVDTPMPPALARPLIDAVLKALSAAGHGALRYVAVELEERVVVLRGRVPTFYLKQMAQSSVRSVAGVESVRNELEVGGGDR